MTTLGRPRLYAILLGGFAFFAVLIAGVGVLGTLSYTVAQRSREFAVRSALGARRTDLIRMVIGQGLIVGGAGVAAGLVVRRVDGARHRQPAVRRPPVRRGDVRPGAADRPARDAGGELRAGAAGLEDRPAQRVTSFVNEAARGIAAIGCDPRRRRHPLGLCFADVALVPVRRGGFTSRRSRCRDARRTASRPAGCRRRTGRARLLRHRPRWPGLRSSR